MYTTLAAVLGALSASLLEISDGEVYGLQHFKKTEPQAKLSFKSHGDVRENEEASI